MNYHHDIIDSILVILRLSSTRIQVDCTHLAILNLRNNHDISNTHLARNLRCICPLTSIMSVCKLGNSFQPIGSRYYAVWTNLRTGNMSCSVPAPHCRVRRYLQISTFVFPFLVRLHPSRDNQTICNNKHQISEKKKFISSQGYMDVYLI